MSSSVHADGLSETGKTQIAFLLEQAGLTNDDVRRSGTSNGQKLIKQFVKSVKKLEEAQ